MLLDLADAARKSGLPVVEVAGWRTRGHGSMPKPRSIVIHHTAGPANGEFPSLAVVRDGRPGLAGPLAHLGLGRSGTVYTIAAGVAWHAGEVFHPDQSNQYAIGIEAEATGVSAWPPVQYEAYVRLCRALCDHYGLSYGRVFGHKEVARPLGRKIDPNFSMDEFRRRLREDEDLTPEQDERLTRIDNTLRYGESGVRPAGEIALKLHNIESRLNNLAVGAIDYDRLAEAVADKLAARLTS